MGKLLTILGFGLSVVVFAILTNTQPTATRPSMVDICPDYARVDEYLSETWEEFIQSVGQSEGFYFEISTDNSPTPISLIGRNTSYAEDGQDLSLDFKIFTPAPFGTPDIQMRAIVLVNQQQISLDQEQFYFDFTLKPLQEVVFTTALPTLPSGVHEIVVIYFTHMDQYPSDALGSQTQEHAGRMTLVVGEALESDLNYQTASDHNWVTGREPRVPIYLGIDDRFYVWPQPAAETIIGQPFSFFLFGGTSSPQPNQAQSDLNQFGLILLKDYRQIPIVNDQPVLYLEVTQDQGFVQIPMLIPAENKVGRYDLVGIRIDNPNWLQCRSHLGDLRVSTDVMINRVSVEVVTN
jgi:hypothetical protein